MRNMSIILAYYKEDKDYVVKSFARLIEAGVYQKEMLIQLLLR